MYKVISLLVNLSICSWANSDSQVLIRLSSHGPAMCSYLLSRIIMNVLPYLMNKNVTRLPVSLNGSSYPRVLLPRTPKLFFVPKMFRTQIFFVPNFFSYPKFSYPNFLSYPNVRINIHNCGDIDKLKLMFYIHPLQKHRHTSTVSTLIYYKSVLTILPPWHGQFYYDTIVFSFTTFTRCYAEYQISMQSDS